MGGRRAKSAAIDHEERTHLVALARRLEELAEDDPPELAALLAEFNRALATDADRRTFLYLHQSQEPEELVDSLLARRAQLPEVTAPIRVTAATLCGFLTARPDGHYDHDAGHDEYVRDVTAVCA